LAERLLSIARTESMIKSSTIIALVMVCLLILSTPLIETAQAAKKNDKPGKTDEKKGKDIQIEEAREAIAAAEQAISEAERKISEAEGAGIDVSEAMDALREGEELLSEAKKLLSDDPQRAAVIAKRAENMARMAVSLVEKALRREETKTEEQLKNYRELVNETREIIAKARKAIEEASGYGGNVTEALQLIVQAEDLLREAESKHGVRIEEAVRLATQARILAEKGLRVSENLREETRARVELRLKMEMAEETIMQAQQAIEEARSKLSSADLDEKSAKPLREILGQAAELLEMAREKLSTNPDAARAIADTAMRMAIRVSERIEERPRIQTQVKAGEELNLSVSGKLSSRGKEFRVENKLQFNDGLVSMTMERRMEKRMDNGTIHVEIVRERILVVGGKTLIEQSRIIERNGTIIERKENTEELNETVTATILQIKQREVNITKIDQAVNVEMLQRSDEQLRFRVSGPDGLGPRIMIIQLDAGAVRLAEDGLVVTVNGEEAKLADSVYDLLAGVGEEPAYVLVKTNSGYQVMVYFPHFSEYIVEIRAIVMRILGAFLDTQTAMLATTAATMTIAVIMALNMYRKRAYRGRVLKLW
jgi:hypothetical protein